MVTFVKEFTFGEIIADTFRIYSGNLLPLFLICFVPLAPFQLILEIAVSAESPSLAVIANLLSLVASMFVYGAVTIAVSDICLGNRPTVKRSYAAIGRVIGRYIGAYLLLMLTVMVGFVLLIVPGVVAAVLLMFALPAVAIERKRAFASLKRSVFLGKGFYWRNFGISLLVSLIAVIAMTLIVTVIVVVLLIIGSEDEFLFNIVMAITGIFVTPLFQIPLVLLYYDMRVRKEFFDGSALAQEMFA